MTTATKEPKGKTRKKSPEPEQLDLIDVTPENSKKIRAIAKKYREAQQERMAWGEDERKQKELLLAEAKNANVQASPDGVIRFRVDDITIKITPRDELVQVKFDEDAANDDDE